RVQVGLDVDPVLFVDLVGDLVLAGAVHDADDAVGLGHLVEGGVAAGVSGEDEQGVGHDVVRVGEGHGLAPFGGDVHAGDDHVVVGAESGDERAPLGLLPLDLVGADAELVEQVDVGVDGLAGGRSVFGGVGVGVLVGVGHADGAAVLGLLQESVPAVVGAGTGPQGQGRCATRSAEHEVAAVQFQIV